MSGTGEELTLSVMVAADGAEPEAVSAIRLPGEFLRRFRLERMLGAGAMGTVWHAVDRSTGRDVAIKFQRPLNDPEILLRFEREGRAMARVSHPGVLTIYDMFTLDGHPCLVTELLTGGTLRQALTREGRLAPEHAVRIAIACLDGLQALHEAGLVHRDVKPDNVLFDEAGEPHVADLGLARDVLDARALTRTGGLMGTPRYMAPEQIRGESATPASDVYAMGVVLHEMLAGRSPFGGPTLADVLAGHLAAPPPPLEAEGVAAPIAVAVRRALAKDPAQRPRSAREMAAQLEATLAARPARAARARSEPVKRHAKSGSPSRPARVGRWARAAGALLAACSLIVAGVLARAVTRRQPGVTPAPASPVSPAAPEPVPAAVADQVASQRDAAITFGETVQLRTHRFDIEARDTKARFAALAEEGRALAARVARADRVLADASTGPRVRPGAVLRAVLAAARLDVDIAREQVALARRIGAGAPMTDTELQVAITQQHLRAGRGHADRFIHVLDVLLDALEISADPAVELVDDRFCPVAALLHAAWLTRRLEWDREHRQLVEERCARGFARLGAALPTAPGQRLAEAAEASWAYSAFFDSDSRVPRRRMERAMEALASSPPRACSAWLRGGRGTAPELIRRAVRPAVPGERPAGPLHR